MLTPDLDADRPVRGIVPAAAILFSLLGIIGTPVVAAITIAQLIG